MNILILRRSAIGDILHVLPSLQTLKHRFPEYHISLLVKTTFMDFFREVPFIDEVTDRIPDSVDIVIDCQGLAKTGLLSLRSGAWLRAGYHRRSVREPAASFCYHRQVRVCEDHIIDRHARLISETLGCPIAARETYRADFLIGPSQESLDFLAKIPEPRLLIHPTTSRKEKNLQPEEWGETISFLKSKSFHPILSCGPGEEDLLAPWTEHFSDLETLPVLPLRRLAHVLSECRLYIGGDTGPTHLADQLRVPVLAGYTRWPPQRNGPYFSDHLVFFQTPPQKERVQSWYSQIFSS